jgi:hypothetical protein
MSNKYHKSVIYQISVLIVIMHPQLVAEYLLSLEEK